MSFRDSQTGQYPVSHQVVRSKSPNTSFPAYFEKAAGYDWVHPVVKPQFNRDTQYVEEGPPVITEGLYYQTWLVKNFSLEQLTQKQKVKTEYLIATMTTEVQNRLDTFARTRNFDGIMSLCTYATSSIPRFQIEGQYGVEIRDLTWAKLYEIMDEVKAGTRQMPTRFSDIEAELPVLSWPT